MQLQASDPMCVETKGVQDAIPNSTPNCSLRASPVTPPSFVDRSFVGNNLQPQIDPFLRNIVSESLYIAISMLILSSKNRLPWANTFVTANIRQPACNAKSTQGAQNRKQPANTLICHVPSVNYPMDSHTSLLTNSFVVFPSSLSPPCSTFPVSMVMLSYYASSLWFRGHAERWLSNSKCGQAMLR